MRTVAEDVAERGPVAKHRPEVEQASGPGFRFDRCEQQTDGDHDEGAEPRDDEGGAPPHMVGHELRDQEREAEPTEKLDV